MKILFTCLLFVNIAGFLAFGIDKYKAIHNKWRIRESMLMLFALLGGGPGCLLGMYLFHHKTRHRKFTIGIPVILTIELLLGCAAAYFYHQPRSFLPPYGKIHLSYYTPWTFQAQYAQTRKPFSYKKRDPFWGLFQLINERQYQTQLSTQPLPCQRLG